MNLIFDKKLGEKYSNNSQKVRVMSESWTKENIFCPNCGNCIKHLENNKKVSDFLCENCLENYEQKSSQKKFKGKIISSEYKTIVSRISSSDKPNFFFLHYIVSDYSVNDFFVVPKYFFVPKIIEKRKALSEKAKRSGWVGSYILFSKIPDLGKIYYVENGKCVNKNIVLERWQKTKFIKQIKKTESKGWILDIINCIDILNKKEFTLSDLYRFESDLKILHPDNKYIKDKIRQQLQFLRNKNYLDFVGKGRYKLK